MTSPSRISASSPHFSPASYCGGVSIHPDCVALGRPARRTARVRLRGLRILSEDWEGPRSERRGGRCEAARRRRCHSTSSRSDNEADAPAPPEPGGRMGVAGDLCVARRRRCAVTSTSSSRLDLARKTHARDPSQSSGRILSRTPCQAGASAASRRNLVRNAG